MVRLKISFDCISKYTFIISLILFIYLLSPHVLQAQTYDLLLRGGHVIDPKNNIDRAMDVAIKDDTIARTAENISVSTAAKVINVEGLYVTPGLIDLHSHNYYGTEPKPGLQ